MRERQGEMVRDAPPEIDVVLAESIELAREKEERPEDARAKRHRHAERRSHTEAPEDPAPDAVARHLGIRVMKHVGVAKQLGAVVTAQRHRMPESRVVDMHSAQRMHAERLSVL